jgi:photosystem I reaction center subunit VIII|tara:strand:+ start:597 stop:707 length:111 start_codon:yes stop_codon:yes gene_type:complete
MTAAFLPPILVPVVTLVFPGICFALFFVLIEQEEVI